MRICKLPGGVGWVPQILVDGGRLMRHFCGDVELTINFKDLREIAKTFK